ncbi:hypothetical protein Tco_1432708, partial [Tanacetum coccineum]
NGIGRTEYAKVLVKNDDVRGFKDNIELHCYVFGHDCDCCTKRQKIVAKIKKEKEVNKKDLGTKENATLPLLHSSKDIDHTKKKGETKKPATSYMIGCDAALETLPAKMEAGEKATLMKKALLGFNKLGNQLATSTQRMDLVLAHELTHNREEELTSCD